MKNILLSFIITLTLITISCSDNSTINSPLQSDNFDPKSIDSKSEILVSKVIDGSVGASISIDTTFLNLNNDTIKILGEIKFDPASFDGVKEIHIIPNFNDCSIQFYPAMNFNKELRFTILFKGVDLQKLGFTDSSNVRFVYISDNGDIEPIEYLSCKLIGNEKFIKVTDAKLSHFSRYSFVR